MKNLIRVFLQIDSRESPQFALRIAGLSKCRYFRKLVNVSGKLVALLHFETISRGLGHYGLSGTILRNIASAIRRVARYLFRVTNLMKYSLELQHFRAIVKCVA